METTNKTESLADRLKAATEKKDPGTSARVSSFWEQSDDDFETAETGKTETDKPKNSAENTGKSETATTISQENQPEKQYSKEMGQASARVFTKMVDMGQTMIFRPILNYKFKKKFTQEERDRLKELEFISEEQYTESDKKLLTKYEKLAAKHEKKDSEIPLNKEEEKDLQDFTAMYCDIKKKELPPEWGIAISLMVIICRRTTDVFFD